MKKIQTDNASLVSKLAIRRWLLGEMQIDRVRVLDACAGAGDIWRAMRAHVAVDTWVRCDLKPRESGTLRLNAAEAMQRFALDHFNVIDIDPYGEPWEAYHHALRRLRGPMIFFLTRGRQVTNLVPSHAVRRVAGLPSEWSIPLTIELATYLDARALAETWNHARILHAGCIELVKVDYYALAVAPL